jgi:hypothetical protein
MAEGPHQLLAEAALYPWYEITFHPAADALMSGCADDKRMSVPDVTEAGEMVDQLTMRASDRDRQQVVDRLRSALEDGRLTMDEYVDRMEAAYKAATYGDLVPLCADLPASPPVIAGPQPTAGAASPAVISRSGCLAGLPTVLKILWTIWLTAVSVNVVVWALVSGTGGHLAYPWPVWVAGPYGAVLFAVSAGIVLFQRSRPPIARPRPVKS